MMFFPGKSGESSVVRVARNSTRLWPIIIPSKQPGEPVYPIGMRGAILPIPGTFAKMVPKPLKNLLIRKYPVLCPRPAGAGAWPDAAARR